MHSIIEIVNGVARNPVYRMKEPVNLTINDGECIKLTGLSRNTYYKYKRELRDEGVIGKT